MTTPSFTTAQGLRLLLVRLHYSPTGTWQHDPDAHELIQFATQKYAALARKYNLAAEDAAYAAFRQAYAQLKTHWGGGYSFAAEVTES